MTRTGPQKIPGASQTRFYGAGAYSGSDMEVNCGVAHTTEGRTLPDYSGGSIAPNVTGVPDFAAKKIRWYQHFDVDESARALANKLGGVQTNMNNAFQIELVGTCDDSKKTSWGSGKAGVDYLHWPTAPDWALAEVAWLVRWLYDYHGVPLTCVNEWLAYGKDTRRPGVTPASYGASPARMTFAQWNSFEGWCGHQHVPENDHGDPGSMDFARVITLAKALGGSKPTTPVTKPTYEPFPGDAWFKKAPKSAVVTAMGKRLVAVGCSAYTGGPGPQWTDADRKSYAKWQRKLGYTGTAADGWPGAKSWAALKVPNV
ncbi:peptidoglycan-binding protein [Streptomyces sp. NPDC002920]